jgi:hypothetical protein
LRTFQVYLATLRVDTARLVEMVVMSMVVAVWAWIRLPMM